MYILTISINNTFQPCCFYIINCALGVITLSHALVYKKECLLHMPTWPQDVYRRQVVNGSKLLLLSHLCSTVIEDLKSILIRIGKVLWQRMHGESPPATTNLTISAHLWPLRVGSCSCFNTRLAFQEKGLRNKLSRWPVPTRILLQIKSG